MGDETYSAEQLEKILGVKARNVHYWVQEGLLEGPGAGRGARYTDEHLAKLFLIQKLREQGLSLPEIKKAIDRIRDADVPALANEARSHRPRETTRATDLITQWLTAASATHGMPVAGSSVRSPARTASFLRARESAVRMAGDSWRRIPLAPDLELHVREPLSSSSQHLLEALLEYAQRLRAKETR